MMLSMDRRAFVQALLATATLPASASAAEVRDLKGMLEPIRVQNEFPALAAAVMKQGTLLASGVTGVRVRGTTIAAEAGDRFHLGSDTKAMTATLAGMLIDAGKLDWGATIGDVLGAKIPGINPALAGVTLEQLLSHSGGIPSDTDEIAKLYFNADAFEYNLPETRLRIITGIKDHAPVSPPGKEFHYANLGYVIAGAMIETAAGVPWEELLVTRLFTPLKLTSAGIGPQATTGHIDAPVGHKVNDDGSVTPMYWGPAADVPPAIGPAGAAHMSILDFATWADWNAGEGRRGPALVKPETLARIHRAHVSTGPLPDAKPGTPQEGEYACGWGILAYDWSNGPVLTHNGSNSMNFARILVDTRADLSIVVCTNFPGAKPQSVSEVITEQLYRTFA
ncbi:MAG: serine hydrolase domain-containing protein [Hyphomicrobiales bacterium]